MRFVADASEPWVAVVRGEGYLSGFAIRATPDPHHACVVAGGGAYLVDVRDGSSQCLDVFPVQHVVEVPEADMLVLADFTELFGIGVRESHGSLGQVWASGRVATDDARVVRVDGVILDCRGLDGWDAPFLLDARTGELVGTQSRPVSSLFRIFGRKDRR